MKFRNGTGQAVQVRLDDGNNSYIWKIVENNEEIDMPEDYARRLGFTEVLLIDTIASGENQKNEGKPLQATASTIGSTAVETKQIDVQKLEKDIDKIKGIGKRDQSRSTM